MPNPDLTRSIILRWSRPPDTIDILRTPHPVALQVLGEEEIWLLDVRWKRPVPADQFHILPLRLLEDSARVLIPYPDGAQVDRAIDLIRNTPADGMLVGFATVINYSEESPDVVALRPAL